MNKALRSTFDPLPRSLSTRGLVSLVLVVVLGTAVTVHRYMESSGHPHGKVYGQGHTQTMGSRIEVRGTHDGSRATSLGTRRQGSGSCESFGSSANGCTAPTPASAPEPTATAPSAYEPQ